MAFVQHCFVGERVRGDFMKRVSVCHISSVHPANDVRIFHKECASLSASGYWDVHLVGNGPLDVRGTGVIFHPLPAGKPANRLWRMLLRGWQAYRTAKSVDADLYHVHDPELLPWAYVLKLSGKKVIYDAHEDVPRDILTKTWLPEKLRRPVAHMFEFFENAVARRFDKIVTATPFIRDRFLSVKADAVDINNYPMLEEFKPAPPWTNKQNEVCYVGMITPIRGILEMCRAMSFVRSEARLNLCGSFSSESLKITTSLIEGWTHVNDLGLVDREIAKEVLDRSIAGIVVFHECANHINAQPNKLFEYMGAGIPVIASHFPLWRQIIEGNNCGLMVDPKDPKAIADAIDSLICNPQEAERLGANGKRAVQEHYNWSNESHKLVLQYQQILTH
jgi:glycosyltransferase involved in cell wall biosynthesis